MLLYTSAHLPLVTRTQLWGTPNAATAGVPKTDAIQIPIQFLGCRVAPPKMFSDMPPTHTQAGPRRRTAHGSPLLGITVFHGRGQLAGKTLCAQERPPIATPSFGRGGCGVPAAVLGSGQGLSLKVLRPRPSLLWVPDSHKRTGAKFSMFLVLPAAFFLIKLI